MKGQGGAGVRRTPLQSRSTDRADSRDSAPLAGGEEVKRILVCASRISHIQNFHLPYLRYFKERGYTVDAAAEGTADIPLIDNCYDMKFVKNPLSPQNLHTVSALKKLMQENRYDMVYSNSTLSGAALRLAYMQMKKPKPYYVHISHGYMFSEKGGFNSFIYRNVEKFTAKVPDALVVMNREDLRLAERYKLGRNIHYINGMGLDARRFPKISDEQRAAARKSLGVDDNGFMLLCVGEFSARKNQTALIEAMSLISRSHPEAVLVLAGSGADLEECKILTQKLELGSKIRFAGQVQEVNLLYRSADMLVSASKMEGLPFNVMEALYCGLPVLASDIKGHSELVAHGENGMLFDIGGKETEKTIAAELDRILTDKGLYEKLRSNASLDKKYLIENVSGELIRILDRDAENRNASLKTEGAY